MESTRRLNLALLTMFASLSTLKLLGITNYFKVFIMSGRIGLNNKIKKKQSKYKHKHILLNLL